MKKISLYFLIFFISSDVTSQNLNDSLKMKLNSFQPYHITIKTNPLSLLWGCIPFTSEFKLQNEFTILPHQSVQIGISYLGKGWPLMLAENAINRSTKNNSDVKIYSSGFRFQYAHRFFLYHRNYEYINEFAPIGIYCGPMLSYAKAEIGLRNNALGNYYVEASNFQLCWMTGYQNILDDNVIFDIYFGMGYKNNELIEHNRRRGLRIVSSRDVPFYGSNFKLILGATIGIALR